MDRETEKELKDKFGFYPLFCGNAGWVANEGTDKLGQLEDIEEELGVDLITLFKQPYCTIFIVKNYNNFSRIEEHTLYSIIPQEKCIVVTFDETKFYWKDYGKTWALTKEELQNEK